MAALAGRSESDVLVAVLVDGALAVILVFVAALGALDIDAEVTELQGVGCLQPRMRF